MAAARLNSSDGFQANPGGWHVRMNALLAFDTATEQMSIALSVRGQVSTHEAAGGALASTGLIPAILALLARAGVALRDLDAIAFGRGPGALPTVAILVASVVGLCRIPGATSGSARPIRRWSRSPRPRPSTCS